MVESAIGLWVPLYLIGGVILLYFGAEGMVLGGSRVALRCGVTPLVVGLTVVSFSTSMPEALSSLVAAISDGSGDIALGNVIGSNIANIGLVFGLSAAIAPLAVHRSLWRREMPLMLAASLILALMMMGGQVTRWKGIILVASMLLYLYTQIRIGRRENHGEELPMRDRIHGVAGWIKAIFYVVGGVGGLVIGAYLLVDGAVALAKAVGMTDRAIGLTIVALGTSLPELATSVVAAYRKKADISIGNVVGSNVFNVLFIVGVVAVIAPVGFSMQLLYIDVPVMFFFCLLMWLFLWKRKEVHRWQGWMMVALYLVYVVAVLVVGD